MPVACPEAECIREALPSDHSDRREQMTQRLTVAGTRGPGLRGMRTLAEIDTGADIEVVQMQMAMTSTRRLWTRTV